MKAVPTNSTPSPISICAADVQREDVFWLWPGYIPRGMLSLVDGNPGTGKSLITLDLAARLTRGRAMPPREGSGCSKPASVLILNAEDDPGRTIRPRLEALGADINRVHLLNELSNGESVTPVTFPGHLKVLEDTIAALQTSLVVIDPLMAFLGGEVDAHKDSDVRRVLAQLKRIAERNQSAILLVRHLNKMVTISEAVYRGGGSIGIIGAARSALMTVKHPATPMVNVLARSKGNLCEEPPALAYTIETTPSGPIVAWLGEMDVTANDLLSKKASTKRGTEAAAEAEAFLKTELANGPVTSEKMVQRAGELGISDVTLRRAKAKLGIRSVKAGMSGEWIWTMPDAPDSGQGKGAHEHDEMSAFEKSREMYEGAHPTVPISAFEKSPEGNEDNQARERNTARPQDIFADTPLAEPLSFSTVDADGNINPQASPWQ
jgi:putative DNA primase/helicase